MWKCAQNSEETKGKGKCGTVEWAMQAGTINDFSIQYSIRQYMYMHGARILSNLKDAAYKRDYRQRSLPVQSPWRECTGWTGSECYKIDCLKIKHVVLTVCVRLSRGVRSQYEIFFRFFFHLRMTAIRSQILHHHIRSFNSRLTCTNVFLTIHEISSDYIITSNCAIWSYMTRNSEK